MIVIFKNKNVTSSFATDSWATIQEEIRNGNIEKYHIGDKKLVELGDISSDSVKTKGIYEVRIANMSTPEECKKEEFSQTACGFVVEFVDVIKDYYMNDFENTDNEIKDVNLGGWPESDMYKLLNDENNSIYSVLPQDLKDVIIPTYVVSGHGNNNSEENFTSTDKLYLLSTRELWGKKGTDLIIDYDTADKDIDTRQLDYYEMKKATTNKNEDYITSKIDKIDDTTNKFYPYWLRTAYFNNSSDFFYVTPSGQWSYSLASNTYGVAPAFRIG